MNHETAIQTLAVESYLLGEMTPSEREEFEQHYFECPECAEDIRDAMQLMAGAKERLRPVSFESAPNVIPLSPKPQAVLKKRFAWLQPQVAAGLISLLAAACIVEAIFIPTLQRRLSEANSPRVPASAFLVPQTRGAAKVVKAAEDAPVILMFDLPDSASGSLQFVLKNQDGHVESRLFAEAPPPGQSATISIPRMDLTPGDYVLVVEAPAATGQDGQELSRYPFQLQRP